MKKILLLAGLALGIVSCNLDVNDDPNYPTTVPSTLIFPSAQNFIAMSVGNNMFNYAGFFVQYYDQLPEANQYNDLTQYRINASTDLFGRIYTNMYAGGLMDLNTIINEKDDVNSADKYAAIVLRSYAFQTITDNMSEAPYSESLLGGNNAMPVWDNGQSIYEGVIAEMDEAEATLDASALSINDLVCDKNLSQWKGFANALRLRMYLRFIDANVDAASYTAKAQALVSANEFFTGDIEYAPFADEDDRRNPWHEQNYVQLNTANHCAAYPMVEYLKATNDDARLAYFAVKATASGQYAGAFPGNKADTSVKDANVSALVPHALRPVTFFSQAELQFLIAEVELRFNNSPSAAKAAYETAIDADYAAKGLSGASSLYASGQPVAWDSAASTSDQLELIYLQKWAALCMVDHMEAWSEMRRTGYPKFSTASVADVQADVNVYTPGELLMPATNALGSGVPLRMWYPEDAVNLNDNTPTQVGVETPVWWDK